MGTLKGAITKMLCSCGKPGVHDLKRRELPYCQECFERLLTKLVRAEIKDALLKLRQTHDYYSAAAVALCSLAKQQVEFSKEEEALIPGCQETQACANMEFLLGYSAKKEAHFPSSITRQELQRFFKGVPPRIAIIEEELQSIEQTHRGTIASIAKWNEAAHVFSSR